MQMSTRVCVRSQLQGGEKIGAPFSSLSAAVRTRGGVPRLSAAENNSGAPSARDVTVTLDVSSCLAACTITKVIYLHLRRRGSLCKH